MRQSHPKRERRAPARPSPERRSPDPARTACVPWTKL